MYANVPDCLILSLPSLPPSLPSFLLFSLPASLSLLPPPRPCLELCKCSQLQTFLQRETTISWQTQESPNLNQ